MTSFYINTYGCSANTADSEQMAGLLTQAHFSQAEDIKDADIVIFNTCTVKTPSENNFFNNLAKFKEEYPHKMIVIAGCIPQADKQKLKQYSLVGTQQIHNIVQAVEESLNDNVLHILGNDEIPPLNMPKVRKNPIVEIIPINRGCLGACTFCKTKEARGSLVSYPIADILEVAKKSLTEGIKEIWLTSQDTFCYGFDIKTNIVELLKELVKLEGDFKIRVGMGNPDHMPKIKEELVEIYKHPKIFKFLHLPLQAGDNQVLEDMKRRYTVEEYIEIVNLFRTHIPAINLMTDIIVGYPTENEEQYWKTLNAVRETSPDSINISRFWPRPGTPAAKLKELPGDVVKRRSRVLTGILSNISTLQNEKWLGWEGKILIDEKGKEGQWIGRNDSYKQVIVEGEFNLGDEIEVKIVKANTFDLRGEVVKGD
jgi:threonylcarbamoyladenosine tRNA methylthiotransferase CDKAL1